MYLADSYTVDNQNMVGYLTTSMTSWVLITVAQKTVPMFGHFVMFGL